MKRYVFAAKEGHCKTQFNLEWISQHGRGVEAEQHDKKAANLFSRASILVHSGAQYKSWDPVL
ncbi:hypothetical protein DID78_05685 [Candidatus Marinamargulisbacteria bacterium SCGC AG-343-D04]|nr:hypothetical protein DID78_05685 [Candidatus Marinamargulisbacteria bacterium SCGC AG-343-D04]